MCRNKCKKQLATSSKTTRRSWRLTSRNNLQEAEVCSCCRQADSSNRKQEVRKKRKQGSKQQANKQEGTTKQQQQQAENGQCCNKQHEPSLNGGTKAPLDHIPRSSYSTGKGTMECGTLKLRQRQQPATQNMTATTTFRAATATTASEAALVTTAAAAAF
jgi:hypothetical protein